MPLPPDQLTPQLPVAPLQPLQPLLLTLRTRIVPNQTIIQILPVVRIRIQRVLVRHTLIRQVIFWSVDCLPVSRERKWPSSL